MYVCMSKYIWKYICQIYQICQDPLTYKVVILKKAIAETSIRNSGLLCDHLLKWHHRVKFYHVITLAYKYMNIYKYINQYEYKYISIYEYI